MKVIVWEMPDGSVRVTVPVAPPRPEETESEYLDRIAAHAKAADPEIAPAVLRAKIPVEALPDRRFRAAWRHAGGTVSVNMAEARKLRKAELLAIIDARLVRVREKAAAADEDGKTADVKTAKDRAKALRAAVADLDAQLAAVATAAALDQWIPPVLSTTD